MQLNIVADAHIWGVEEAFQNFTGYQVNLDIREASEIDAESVQDADVLISRSSVQINENLLKNSSIRFVGTATVGDDHVDQVFLTSRDITFASAAGSSTGSVLEYMLCALLYWQQKKGISLAGQTLGVVGVGRIGAQVAGLARKLGMNVLLCDPPRMRQESEGIFISFKDLLQRSDMVTLHVPLLRNGLDQTWHLCDTHAFSHFKGHTLINAARGNVVSQDALLDWLNTSTHHDVILDCWEDEPMLSKELLQHDGLMLGTAHIAGHSLDGKAANTFYVYRALCQHLGVDVVWKPHLPSRNWPDMTVTKEVCAMVVKGYYDIEYDSIQLRTHAWLEQEKLAQQFKKIRRYYPIRRSWLKW